jgi:hypothetical protein
VEAEAVVEGAAVVEPVVGAVARQELTPRREAEEQPEPAGLVVRQGPLLTLVRAVQEQEPAVVARGVVVVEERGADIHSLARVARDSADQRASITTPNCSLTARFGH